MKFLVWFGLTVWTLFSATVPVACAGTGSEPLRILVLGDSLTAGYGLAGADAFPEQLKQALANAGHRVDVINAGVSGDTSAGGLSRLDWALVDGPDMAIVELGANDALRGLPPEQTRDNLSRIIDRLRRAGVEVLLAGMLAPRNLGPDYYTKFDSLYSELAKQHGVMLYPFFLEGVAGNPQLNLADGLHPNRDGIGVIVERILPYVVRMIETRSGRVSSHEKRRNSDAI